MQTDADETASKRNVYICRVLISCLAKRFRGSWSRNFRTRALSNFPTMFLGDRKRLLSYKPRNRPQFYQSDLSMDVTDTKISAKSFTNFGSYNKSSFYCMLHCLDANGQLAYTAQWN